MPVFHHDAVRPALICRTGEWAGIARVTADVTAAGTFQFCTLSTVAGWDLEPRHRGGCLEPRPSGGYCGDVGSGR